MDITVHTVCFNEEKMLPHFLNYYGRIASKIFVYDNMSTDRTVDIALSYPNVEVSSFDTANALSEVSLITIRNTCWKKDQSDFSIVCDTDEFLFCDDLRGFLAARPEYQVYCPVGFDMVSDRFPSRYDQLITDQVKHGCESHNYSKMAIFQPRAVAEMNYGPGSHDAEPIGKLPLRVYDAANHGRDLKLLHYKNMGFDYRFQRNQFLSKRLKGPEFEKYRFGFHYGVRFEDQFKEYQDLSRRATKVIS